jgi:hypothetical protein
MNGFCAVAFALTGSTLATLFMNRRYMQRFEASLDDAQKSIYHDIQTERLRIYFFATFLGSVAGVWTARRDACMSVSLALTVQTLVYCLWPKTRYMMEHVNTPEQSALWIQKYRHMSLLGHVGTAVGLLLYILRTLF